MKTNISISIAASPDEQRRGNDRTGNSHARMLDLSTGILASQKRRLPLRTQVRTMPPVT